MGILMTHLGEKNPNNSVDKKNLKGGIIFKYLTIDIIILNRDGGTFLYSGNINEACIAGEKERNTDRETTWLNDSPYREDCKV